MNILYIGYWNIDDPLTVSTVLPNLMVLSEFNEVERIVFVNIERKRIFEHQLNLPSKVTHKPFFTHPFNSKLANHCFEFFQAPKFVRRLIKQYSINFVIARGSPAGAIAYRASRFANIPFIVESFEPHSSYMRESGTWKFYSLKYFLSNLFEKRQKKSAKGLLPVSNNYLLQLMSEGVDNSRIVVVPCSVDKLRFVFSMESRKECRRLNHISEEAIVGVYAGRYGGLYMEEDAFLAYKEAFNYFGYKFFLIILTGMEYHPWLQRMIHKYKLPKERVLVKQIHHSQMPSYLSASDFAFATYSEGKNMAFLSPVKIGEYWANGLPILLTNGVGDEAQFLAKSNNAGVLFTLEGMKSDGKTYFTALSNLLNLGNRNRVLAQEILDKRDIVHSKEAYRHFLELFDV